MVEADSVPDLLITMGNQLEFVRPRRPIFVLAAFTAFNHDSCGLNHVLEINVVAGESHGFSFIHTARQLMKVQEN